MSLWQQNPTGAGVGVEESKCSVMERERQLPKQAKGKKPSSCRQRGLYMQRPRKGKSQEVEEKLGTQRKSRSFDVIGI